MLPYNKNLKKYAGKLRKDMTETEQTLWSKIRNKQLKGYQFYRQKILGDYIIDFYCPKANLVIELDGGQHYSNKGMQKDRIRDNYLVSLGLKALHFSDKEVFENLTGVLERIWENLKSP